MILQLDSKFIIIQLRHKTVTSQLLSQLGYIESTHRSHNNITILLLYINIYFKRLQTEGQKKI